MEALIIPIYSTEGKEVDSLKFESGVFGEKVHTAAIHQAVTLYRANQRKGLAATKTRGEVRGGGRKPWKQKGTGRARAGSTRSPLWRHGGVVFGPHPRDFSYTIPNKVKKLALKSALLAKLQENNFTVLENFKLETAKTKEANKIFLNLNLTPLKGVLLLLDKIDNNLKLALANIDFLTISLARDTNAYEVLSHKKIIITKDALNVLMARFSTDKKATPKAKEVLKKDKS